MRTSFSILFLVFTITAFSQAPSKADQARDALDAALKDKNPDTRKEAVVALSLAGTGDPYATWLEKMLDDKDVEVRVATVSSLVDLKSSRTIPALHKALKDEVPEVKIWTKLCENWLKSIGF